MAIPTLFTSPKAQVDLTKFGPFHWNTVTALLSGLLDGADANGLVATKDSASATGVTWAPPAAAAAGALTGATLAANVLASSLTSVGTLASLTVTANVTAANVVLGGAGIVVWSARTVQSSPLNGQLNLTNNAQAAGVGLDIATDGILKVRTRAQSADASLTALNLTASVQVLAAQGTATAPGFAFTAWPTLGFFSPNNFTINLGRNGTTSVALFGGGAGGIGLATTSSLWFSSTTDASSGTNDFYMTRFGAGQLTIGQTTVIGIGLDLTTDGVLKIRTRAQTGDASLTALNLTASGALAISGAGSINFLAKGYLSSPTDAKWVLQNQALSAGVGLDFATDGVLKIRTRAQTGNAALWSGADGIAVTSTDGLLVANDTLSTSGVPVQQSPRLRFRSHVWNTTVTAADNTDDWVIESVPVSGTSPSALLKFGSLLNGGAAAFPMTLSFAGGGVGATLTLSGGGGVGVLKCDDILMSSGRFFRWVNKSAFSSSVDAQINVTNFATTAGVGLDVATDAVLKVRTRAQSAYATVDALGYSVGGVAGASKVAGPVASITVVNGIVTAIS